MTLERDLIGRIRRLDEFDLRRLQMLVAGLISVRTGQVASFDPPARTGDGRAPATTYRRQLVRCGRQNCTSCPHGPYWYAYWREDGRLRSRYVGKQLPPGATAASPAEDPDRS